MSDYPFSSLLSFQRAFTAGLSGLLKKGGLGPFILVCANASFDRRVQEATADELASLFRELSREYVGALADEKLKVPGSEIQRGQHRNSFCSCANSKGSACNSVGNCGNEKQNRT